MADGVREIHEPFMLRVHDTALPIEMEGCDKVVYTPL
jgi:hypothetical protein